MGKNFSCKYLKENGLPVGSSMRRILAEDTEDAARIFAENFPKPYPRICVKGGLGLKEHLFDHREGMKKARAAQEQRKAQELSRKEKKKRDKQEAAQRQRLESLQKLHSSVESADGNLAGLSYIELSALIENLKDFPVMRDKIGPEECAVREELYKVAFFDRNLQTELQVELLRDLKSAFTDLQSGKSGSGAGQSNLARNAAMVGGLAALQKLNQIEENTADVSEGFGFD